MSGTAAELLDQLEELSPAELEQEISDLKARIARAHLVLKLIKTKSPDRSRKTSRADGNPSSRLQSDIDTGLPPRERIASFLAANGPSTFRAIVLSAGLMVGPLKKLLESDPAFVFDEDRKLWSLKHSA